MNKEVMQNIFPEEMNRIKQGLCPFCERKINIDEFRDALSRKEFAITGVCQDCQDGVFS